MERYRRAALTAVASGAAKGMAVLTALITVPLTVGYLGMERYGLWMTISSVIAMLAFADLGLGNGLMNVLSEANGRDDREAARHYVSSALFLLVLVALMLAVGFTAAYPRVPWRKVFNVSSPQAVTEAGPALAVFVACFVINIPLGVIQRVQLGYQEGFANGLWNGLGSLLELASVLLAVHLKAGLPWLVLAMAGAPVVANGANGVVLFGFQRRWLLPGWHYASLQAARKVFSLGILFFVLQVAAALVFASDNIVAAQIMGPASVAQYSVPMKLFNVAPFVLMMFMIPLWPAYGEAIARGDLQWVKKTLARSVQTAFLVVAPVSAVLVLFGRQVIHLWVGPQIHPSFLLLLGLGIWMVLSTVGNSIAVFWNGANVVLFQVIFAILIGASALVGKILLARWMGIPGIIWGTVLAYIVFAPLPTIIYLPRVFRRLQQGSEKKEFQMANGQRAGVSG
jgi:O-antigen/teichoic acid export membrane protein